jgi:hypothetical protein
VIDEGDDKMDDLIQFKRVLEYMGLDVNTLNDPKYGRHIKQTLRRAILRKSLVKQFLKEFGTVTDTGEVVISNEIGSQIKEEWFGLAEYAECKSDLEVVFGTVTDTIKTMFLKIEDDDKLAIASKELGEKLVNAEYVKYFSFNDKGHLITDDFNNYISVLKYDKYLQERIKYDDFYHHYVYCNRFMNDGDVTEVWGYISRVYDLRNINYLGKLIREENNPRNAIRCCGDYVFITHIELFC